MKWNNSSFGHASGAGLLFLAICTAGSSKVEAQLCGSSPPGDPTEVACTAASHLIGCQTCVVVKNDSLDACLTDGELVEYAFEGWFNGNEEANVWLTAPCDGFIVAIHIFWQSPNGGFGQTIENVLAIYDAPNWPNDFPIRGNTFLTDVNGDPINLIGPALIDGGINEFAFVDENNQVPMRVPVSAGQNFVVSFEFFNNFCSGDDAVTGCIPLIPTLPPCSPGADCRAMPTIPHDNSFCEASRNAVSPNRDVCGEGMCGDFIIRAIVECGSADGACCLPDQTCILTSGQDCASQLGLFSGIGTECGPPCPVLVGACCVGTQCVNLEKDECEITFSGTWLGPNTDCAVDDPCGLTSSGACCLPDKTCTEVNAPECLNLGGTYNGNNTFCTVELCDPVGACCIGGSCFGQLLTEGNCLATGGSWAGAGTDCSDPSICIPKGACCFSTGFCLNDITEGECIAIGSATWEGEGTVCNPDATCPSSCPSDCGLVDGTVDVEDLLDLLASWGSSGGCDSDPNGVVDVDDLLDLLAAWGPCP
ncbi:MAG: hypothetical protein O7G85_17475 [Planctomycetota bacterium]|nr:hypothetical protein [Planctomycetota bacterium]